VVRRDSANWNAARQVLLNRMVETAIFENSSETILSEGIAYDWCQVGVVTNIDPDHKLPAFYIEDADQMVKVARTQVDIVLPSGTAVLNAADARVADLAALCDGSVMFFAIAPNEPVIVAHQAQNGRSVFVRNGKIVLATGKQETVVSSFAAIGFADPAQQPANTESLLAAVAAAWALGMDADLIRAGIETFEHAHAPVAA
jgi:cyanophycin synthetase